MSNVCITQLTKRIYTTLERYTALSKSVSRNSAQIETCLLEKLIFPQNDTNSNSDSQQQIPHSPSPVAIASTSTSITCVQSPVKTRRDCDIFSSSKKVNNVLKYRLKEVKRKHHQLRSFTANVKRRLNFKSKDQTLRRSSKIEELKASEQSLEKTNATLSRKYVNVS